MSDCLVSGPTNLPASLTLINVKGVLKVAYRDNARVRL